MVGEEVKEIEIGLGLAGESSGSGRAILKCKIGGKQCESSKCSCHNCPANTATKSSHKMRVLQGLRERNFSFFIELRLFYHNSARIFTNVIYQEVENHKNGSHVSHVVRGNKKNSKSCCVEPRPAIIY